MFTGIIEAMGQITKQRDGHLALITSLRGTARGQSLAVNGVCLTVTRVAPAARQTTQLTFDLSPETKRSTSLGHLSAGRWVNLERPLKLSDRLAGHLVHGHVDGVGIIRAITPHKNAWRYTIGAHRRLLRYLVPKGSVAVDGISLTVVEVLANAFTVWIIPYTSKHTALQYAAVGDAVNLEVDVIAKYVERYLLLPSTHAHAIRRHH